MISGYGSLTKPMPGAQINPAHPLSKGLVGYWLFNEGAGSLANDISGHGNHGTLTNMAPNVPGSGWGGSMSGGSLQFAGSVDYVDCGNDASLDITDAITVEAWVKQNAYSSHAGVIHKGANSWILNNYFLFISGTDNKYPRIFFQGLSDTDFTSGIEIGLDSWHHIVAYYNGSEIGIYVDAVSAGSNLSTGSIITNAESLKIAQKSQFTDFNGSIDSVRIYNRAISAAEVKQLYHDPFCNILKPRHWYVPSAGPSGVIMNQFQRSNIGADLFNGALQ